MSGCTCGSGAVNHGSLEGVAVAFRERTKVTVLNWCDKLNVVPLTSKQSIVMVSL